MSAPPTLLSGLAVDSAVTRVADGHYRASLAPDWQVFGPSGGYLAVIALRAAGAHTTMTRPVSISCHFLRMAGFDEVDLYVTTLRSTVRAESLRVEMRQRGKPVLEALVWAIRDKLPSKPRRQWAPPPAVAAPEGLPDINELSAADGLPLVPIAQTCIDSRPAEWAPGGVDRPAGDPVVRGWMRFRGTPTFPDDPWLDHGRSAFIVDIEQLAAIAMGFAHKDIDFTAATLDLYVAFHDAATDDDWLLVEACGLAGADGVIGGHARVWGRSGVLVGSGSSQLLCRVLR